MNRMLPVLFVLLIAFPATAFCEQRGEIEVRIERSEVLSLLYFAQAAMGDPHKNGRLRDLFEDHATEEAREGLKLVEAALSSGPGSIRHHSRAERPSARYVGSNFDDVLEAHAGVSQSVGEFVSRTTGLIPVGQQDGLLRGLEAVAPVHREHVWKPSQKFLVPAERELRRLARVHDLERRFAQAATFYGASWPSSVPIRIYLVGVPGKIGHMRAHSAGPLGVVETVEDDELQGRLAVIFHELCHSLYKAQPIERQLALERAWGTHPLSTEASIAYAQVNEGLATALGNGWLEVAMRGDRVFGESWYADPVVDGFGKTLYPLVKHYLDAGKTMDQAFVDYAVALFITRFPNVARNPRVIFRQLFLGISTGLAPRVAIRAAQRELGSTSIWNGQPLNDERTLGNYAKALPTLMILTPSGADELEPYPDVLRKGFAEHADNESFIYAHVVDGRMHVLVVVSEDDEIRPALAKLSDLDHLEDGMMVSLR